MAVPAGIGVEASGLPPLNDQANAVLAGTITAVGPTAPFAFRGPMNLSIWASLVQTLNTTAGSLAATVNSATGLAAGAAIASANLPGGSTVGVLSGTNVTLALAPRTQRGIFLANGLLSGNFSTDRILGATITIPQPAVEGVKLPANTTVTAVVQQYVAASANMPAIPAIVQLSANPTAVPANNDNPIPFQENFIGNAILVTGADAAASFTGAGIAWTGTVQLERSFDGGVTWIVCNVGTGGAPAQWTAGPISITFGEPEKQVLYRLNAIAYSAGTINYRISQTGGAAESLAIGPLSGG